MEGPEVNDSFNEEEYGHIPMSDNAKITVKTRTVSLKTPRNILSLIQDIVD